MEFKTLAYNVVRIGEFSVHIRKTSINGKIRWHITRVRINK